MKIFKTYLTPNHTMMEEKTLISKDFKGLLYINDVTFLGGGGVSQKVTKSDRGEGGVSLI